MPFLTKPAGVDGVLILNLDNPGDVDSECRLHPDLLVAVHALLDEVAATPGPLALVTTTGGRFFSNGLDLAWVEQHPDEFAAYARDAELLFARILALPMVTVAALPGHTFGAGAMLALSHDRRIMRADKGFVCFPEVDINIPFTAGMNRLIESHLTPLTLHEAITTGRRYGGVDAAAAGLVHTAVSAEELLPTALEYAAAHARLRGETLGAIKSRLYADTIALLGT